MQLMGDYRENPIVIFAIFTYTISKRVIVEEILMDRYKPLFTITEDLTNLVIKIGELVEKISTAYGLARNTEQRSMPAASSAYFKKAKN